ncbi:MAG: NUDIX hydrolase [Gammaproteobacteria bacterium]|jgi:8-oxo-dGTP pyrophosphatase MutT (NUDIX family)|nr:NUDIX hydrolase [Gammaproteobacteria bacterium]MBU1408065.1 NUDIX hydrolase [Gammaproteobacteria bacterium]MBU1532762.1 NUDIX hydrolase [Gammaproteobacteria bacterium]
MSETETWLPHVVAAAIVERDGKFLLVEEHTAEGLRLNQPAGHWERGETLIEAVRREALEETAHHVEPLALLGCYTTHYAQRDITYLRFAYVCSVTGFDAGRALDHGIVRAVWLTPEELAAHPTLHRSPLVMRCVQDYLAGRRFPLDFVSHV